MPAVESSPASGPPRSSERRPALVLVAVDMGRDAPTETGKSWNWACALARCWQLHVVTAPGSVERCRVEPLAAGWEWHSTREPAPTTLGMRYYQDYRRWCRDVEGVVRDVVRTFRPARLHHVTLASFRVLPRYDRCGVRYSLGPLGGGEATPWSYVRTARLPPRAMVSEFARPWLNNTCALLPGLRAVMRGADLAMGTTRETERVLQRMGARRTAVVFPDRVPGDIAASPMVAVQERARELAQRVRLVWSGRALWWKGGQLAVELLRRLIAVGVRAELTIFSHGPALGAWQRQITRSGVAAYCRVAGFVSRRELIGELGRAHVFVYPTLHDSSSTALLEAYAVGLPSLTTGVGGPAVVATRDTGYNDRALSLDAWLEGAVACVQLWQREPARWVEASVAAQARVREFGPEHLNHAVDRWLSPAALSP